MNDKPTQKTLESGWTLVRWHRECFAQLPPNFSGGAIPDEYIFKPAWNRERVNRWWATR